MSSPLLRVVFAGTPDFAASTLQALIESRHEVIAVYTQPDRPAGRGRKILPSPVKQLAARHRIEAHQPENLRTQETRQQLHELCPDVMVVVAYGQMLPPDILQIPGYGCLNVHASLLPRWRGAAPIQRAILAGDRETGVTIMQMDEGLDTGDILNIVRTSIGDEDNSRILHDRLAEMGAAALVKVLDDVAEGRPPEAVPQSNDGACYATKLTKSEAHIDWSQAAAEIMRAVNGFNPWPVACTQFDARTLRIWNVSRVNCTASAAAGTVIAAGHNIIVATGNGCLELLQVQPAGGKRMSGEAFLNSRKEIIRPGYIFGKLRRTLASGAGVASIERSDRNV